MFRFELQAPGRFTVETYRRAAAAVQPAGHRTDAVPAERRRHADAGGPQRQLLQPRLVHRGGPAAGRVLRGGQRQRQRRVRPDHRGHGVRRDDAGRVRAAVQFPARTAYTAIYRRGQSDARRRRSWTATGTACPAACTTSGSAAQTHRDNVAVPWTRRRPAAARARLTAPFNNLATALNDGRTPGQIVRIVGNAGAGRQLGTLLDNRAYQIGFDSLGSPLPDGSTMEVPKGVTVMIDAGAIFQMRRARIGVGSSAVGIDRCSGALQVLGAPLLLRDTNGNGSARHRRYPGGGPRRRGQRGAGQRVLHVVQRPEDRPGHQPLRHHAGRRATGAGSCSATTSTARRATSCTTRKGFS